MLRCFLMLLAALSFGFMPLNAQVRSNAARGLDPKKAITQYVHEAWQTEQGLPQNSVQAIAQTPDGYIWLATQEGLVRFDGYAMKIFNKTNSVLPANNIKAIATDKSGTLWIATENTGIMRYQRSQFHRFTTTNGLTSNTPSLGGEAMTADPKNGVWIATLDGGINHIRDNTVAQTLTVNNGLLSDRVNAVMFDRDEMLWAGTDKGLQKIDPATGKIVEQMTRANGLVHDVIQALCEDLSGNIWIGTQNGLQMWNGQSWKTFSAADGIGKINISTLLCDSFGVVWIGTVGEGLIRYSLGQFTYYKVEDGLTNTDVACLHSDNEGGLLIGTFSGGLNRLRNGSASVFSRKVGLDDPWSILEDKSGTLWFSMFAYGVTSVAPNGTIKRWTMAQGLPSNKANGMYEDTDGSLWLGTRDAGICRIYNGKITERYTVRDGLPNDRARAFLRDRKGRLWIGTDKGACYLYQGAFKIYGKQQGLSDRRVPVLHEDRKGRIWVGTAAGLFVIEDEKIVASYNAQNGLSMADVLCLHEDHDETMWIGTNEGGTYRLKNNSIRSIGTQQGLFDDVVYSLLEDDNGYVWSSCNKGIFRVKKSELNDVADGKRDRVSCRSFGVSDGMAAAECNGGSQPSAYRTRDGRFWFPTIRGAVVIDPNNLVKNEVPPNVIVEELRVDGTHSTTATLPATAEKLELQYTATCLTAAERVKFKYILEGYDKDWVEAGNRRTAYYNNLPRGRNYRFRVIACNNDGVWNETGAWAEFTITPYWWETWWFYGLCVMFVSGGAYQGFRWRTRRLRAKAEELERLVDVRTKEVQEQAREIQLANTQLSEKNAEITASRERLEVMSEVGRSLTASLAVETIITNLYRRVSEVMDTTVFGIGIVREAKGVIEYKLAMGKGERFPPYERDLHDTNQFPVWSIREQKPVFINDVDVEGVRYIPSFREKINVPGQEAVDYAKSLLYVPLLLQGSPIGVLSVQSYERNAYSQGDLETLQTLANYAAIAIANAESAEEIIRQKAIVEEFNRNIQDSIRYAKRIQDAMLPSTETLNRLLPEHFIFFRPKDVVSGDFYWCKERDGFIFVAAVDCTGHGVPGAFMSLIGNAMLNELTERLPDPRPELILREMHYGLQRALKQRETGNEDGMDVCLCRIDLRQRRVLFAGAMIPLYVVMGNDVIEYRGTQEELGGSEERHPVYEAHEIDLSGVAAGGAMLYLTSDGYKDQFNQKRKKLTAKGVKEVIAGVCGLEMAAQREGFGAAMQRWMGSTKQMDDMLVLGVRV